MADLIFRAPQTSNPSLVFGQDDGPPPVLTSTLTVTGTLPALTASVAVAVVSRVSANITLPGLTASVTVAWDSRTERPTVARVVAPFEDAVQAKAAVQSDYQRCAELNLPTVAPWDVAQAVNALLAGIWQEAASIRQWKQSVFQRAVDANAGAVNDFQEAVRVKRGETATYQEAIRTVAGRTSKFQEAYRDRRNDTGSLFQRAVDLSDGVLGYESRADDLSIRLGSRYQEAWVPRPGTSPRPLPPTPDPCYLPDPSLLFAQAPGGANLIFVCERHDPGPEPGETVVIPVQRVYIVVNNATLIRLPTGDIIPTLRMSMSLDVDSWTWSFNASLPWQALSLVQPVDGEPVDVQAEVNGQDFRFVVEKISSERTFTSRTIAVSGRGRAALLDAPYAPILSFGNTLPRTAQQLMGDVLTLNGIPLGWSVDWGITDWSVPGGVWTHQGTYISALNNIAAAPGAYIQPHPTDKTLRVLPRYPAMPHQWGTLPVDYEIPAAVSTREGLQWDDLPTYDRVFVTGTSNGVQAEVTRAGSSGELIAQMVTDPLITHIDAARQRAIASLSPAGRRTMVSMRTPVFETAGVITPGKMVRYVDGATTRLGLVRGVQVEVGLPEVWQTLELESYT